MIFCTRLALPRAGCFKEVFSVIPDCRVFLPFYVRCKGFLGFLERRIFCSNFGSLKMRAPIPNPQPATPTQIMIKDLRPSALNNINTVFIMLEKGATMKNDTNLAMCMSLAADQTAAVHLLLWGDECNFFQPGDIVRLTNGIFSTFNGNMVLRAGRKGKLEKVGEFTMVYTENPNMSKLQWVQEPSNPSQWIPKGLYSPQTPQVPHSKAPSNNQRSLP